MFLPNLLSMLISAVNLLNLIYLTLVLCCLLTSSKISANTNDESIINDMAESTLIELINDFQPNLTTIPALDLKNIIEIEAGSEFAVITDLDNKKIHIPLRFIQQMLMTIDAAVYASEHKEVSKFLVGYHWKLQSELAQPVGMNFTTFWEWRKLPNPSPKLADKIQEERKKQIKTLMAFPIAHEIGHLVRGHIASSAVPRYRSNTQEYEADAFAKELLLKSDIPLLPALAAQMPRYLVYEVDYKRSVNRNLWTHPSTACRLSQLVGDKELPLLWKVENYYLLLGALSGSPPAELQAELLENKKFCAEFSTPATTFIESLDCQDIKRLLSYLKSNPKYVHSSNLESTEPGEIYSTPKWKLKGANECSYYTSARNGEEYYSYECDWRLGLTGDSKAISNVLNGFTQQIAVCLGATPRLYNQSPRIKSKIKVNDIDFYIEANTSQEYPKLNFSIRGINGNGSR